MDVLPDRSVAGLLTAALANMFPDTTPILLDHFTGADGTLLTAHTPDIGGPWGASGSQLVIHGNQAGKANAAGSNPVALGHDWSEFSAVFTFGALTPGDHFDVYLSDDGAGEQLVFQTFPTFGALTWADTGNNNLTVQQDGPNDLVPHTWRLVKTRTTLTVYLDGVVWSETLLPAWFIGGTGFSLHATSSSAAWALVDNVSIKP